MEKNILVLTSNGKTYFSDKMANVNFEDVYNEKIPKKLLKILRNTPLVRFCLKDWNKKIQFYDIIIIFDTIANIALLKYLYKKVPNKRIILYYRNKISSVKKALKPEKLVGYKFELWSYNLHDCKKYDFKYNSQVVDKQKFEEISTKDIKYDLVFLGYSKGRDNEIKSISNYCKKNNLNIYFYVPDLETLEDNMCKDGKKISYDNYIEIIKQSKAILDIVNDTNYGLTLRPLEALFLNKKIVTNYKDIEEYDFYKKENVFIIENNDIKELSKFLQDNNECIWAKDKIEEYDVKKWIERFL